MRPFNIELWKAGEPVVTRDGQQVEQLTYFDSRKSTHKLVGIVDGDLYAWLPKGYFFCENRNSDFDLFHPEPEMWVNVYQHNDSQWTSGNIMPSKEEAEERAPKDGINTRYIGTYKLVKE